MEPRVRALLPAVVAACVLAACGGSNGNGGDNPSPNPGGGDSQNPCASASAEPGADLQAPGPSEAALRKKGNVLDRNPRWRVFDALWTHRQKRNCCGASGPPRPSAGTPSISATLPSSRTRAI